MCHDQKKTENLEHSADVDKIPIEEGKKKPVTDGIEARENLEEKVAKRFKLNEKVDKRGITFICIIYH